MFLDQITSIDGAYLLTWDQLKAQLNKRFKGPRPKWHTSNLLISSQSRRLINPLNNGNI